MLRHNLILLYRNFKQFKSSFFINLIGLSTGLACTILIYLWTVDELSFDRFHEKESRLYQVMGNESIEGTIKTSSHTYDFLSIVLKEEMPEVEYAAVTTPKDFFPSFSLYAGKGHVRGIGKFAEPDFLNIFSYPLIEGHIESALSADVNAVISTSLAKRLFGTHTNIVGKTFEWQIMDLKQDVIVSGVFNDVPANASEHFDFILPFDAFRKIMGAPAANNNWDNRAPFQTYLVVRENIDVSQLEERIKNLVQSKTGRQSPHALFLKPYGDNYLYGRYDNGVQVGGRIEYVRLFVIIAVIILLIACINFINLFTAKASRRVREVGIKKAIGAQRKTLVQQYLVESVVMSVISLLMAFAMTEMILPQFNEITGKQLSLTFDLQSMVVFISISILTGLLAGAYPAVYISGFQSAQILRGQLIRSVGEFWVRKGLVVFQFALSIIFIVGVLVVHNQIAYLQSRNLGYDKNNVLFFESEGKVAETASTFIAELKRLPGVLNASSMLGNIVGESGGTPGKVRWNDRDILMHGAAINYELLETLGIEIKAGRTFSKEFPADREKVIYNQKAIDEMGISDPVGQIIDGREILGVVQDFHFQSLHEVIKPFCFRLEPDFASTIMVRIKPDMELETINALDEFYKAYNPGFAFNYRFMDQAYQAQYESEKRVGMLSKYFALLAIIISCLGLVGLAAFTIERRSKEIGIRKILGLSDLGVVWLISLDSTKMVLLSVLVGLPLSLMIASEWLENFAYKAEIPWWYSVLATTLALGITWLTVGVQTIKASRVSPVRSLRSE